MAWDLFGTKALRGQLTQLTSQLTLQRSIQNFNTQIFPHYQAVRSQLIYQTRDDIFSVICRIAETAARIPFYGEYKDGSELKPKDKLHNLLDQLTFESKKQMYTEYLVSGEFFALKDVIELGVNAGQTSLRFLNPNNVQVIISQGFPSVIIGYQYRDEVTGETFPVELDEAFFIKEFNPGSELNNQFRGLSKVRVLVERITRLKAQMDISTAQMQNGGVPGIVYDETPGITAEVIGPRKDSFGRFLQNKDNKGAPYFAGGKMGYIAIGSTLADLTLSELAAIDFDKVCNVFGISSILMNEKSASTESNVKEMVKAMYTNAVQPLVYMFEGGLNTQVVPGIGTEAVIKCDFSDVPELQEDMLAKMQAYAAAPVMIPNAVLEAMGQKRVKGDENMDKVYVKTGYTLLEDLSVEVAPIDNTANDYNNVVAMAANKLTRYGG